MKVQKQTAIALALMKQGLYHTPTYASQTDALTLLRRLGCIQLDTLNVLTRSHNLVFLARMQEYTEEWFWQLYEEKHIFEGYVHALSILPIEEYPYWIPSMQAFRDNIMAQDSTTAEFLERLYHKSKGMTTLNSRDLADEPEGKAVFQRSPDASPKDWTTTPVRWGLDSLWRSGMLVQVRDRKFNKVYHTLESWMPEKLRIQEVSVEETYRRYTRLALDAMGIATIADLADYFRLKREKVAEVVQSFLGVGEFVEVELEGNSETHYIQASDLGQLEMITQAGPPEHCALLSPFDNLIWSRERMLRLWGVDYRLECYIPQAKRKYGYYALPVLVRGRIVGTIDLKMDRKKKCLIVKKWVVLDESEEPTWAGDVVALLRRLMGFLGAVELVVEDEDAKILENWFSN